MKIGKLLFEATELGQARSRIAVVGAAFLFMLSVHILSPSAFKEHLVLVISAGGTYFILAFIWYENVRRRPSPSAIRKVLAIITDISIVSIAFALSGPSGAGIYALYVWVLVGNGHRFGPKHLKIATYFAGIGLVIAVTFSPFWHQYPFAGIGLFIGLITISVFYYSALTRLHDANRLLHEKAEMYEDKALRDSLTGLYNREGIYAAASSHLGVEPYQDAHVAIIYIDIDGFKLINDNHDHNIGDNVLIEIGRRIRTCVRHTDKIGRMGGDEYVVLLFDITNKKILEDVANKLCVEISKPYLYKDNTLFVSASIGVSYSAYKDFDIDELIKKADKAMYHVKKSGKNNWYIYNMSPQ